MDIAFITLIGLLVVLMIGLAARCARLGGGK